MARELRKLERVWHNLGRHDPLWAALTEPGKEEGGWSSTEFFRTGEAEIDAVLERANSRGWLGRRGRALDFGCGAGRLTQALAARFDRVDGVDISSSMIDFARRHNRHGDRCRFVHRTSPDLEIFRDGEFDFIYSAVTLQHIPPDYARKYISEFVRLLPPHGLLVFQALSHRAPVEATGLGGRTVAAARLPSRAFAATVSLEGEQVAWGAGEKRLLQVSVRNDGSQTWPAGARDDGLFVIQVGNRWRAADGRLVVENDGRTPLPHDLLPGASVTLFLEVTAPRVDGEYVIDVDMVQEHVAWFQEHGSRPFRAPCRVRGGESPGSTSPSPRRFGERFPRLRAALVGAGLDAIRGGFGRYRARVRTGRWYQEAMLMHCLPRSEVITQLGQLGAHVLDVEQELTSGGYQSCRYWVSRRPPSNPT